jgi:hypothetical protein
VLPITQLSKVHNCVEVRSLYWIGLPPEAENGSVGAVPPVSCQIVLPAFTANERVPVVPFVIGTPVA